MYRTDRCFFSFVSRGQDDGNFQMYIALVFVYIVISHDLDFKKLPLSVVIRNYSKMNNVEIILHTCLTVGNYIVKKQIIFF